MPRKVRLEYPGAIYHVINRGNYQSWIFREEGAKQAFEACLFDACQRSEWVLHAFVVMGNHYHLAVETPLGNLVTGMQWLQSTFANRFNKLRDAHGHLFQGRYKALLIEVGDALGQVSHYIHLNPVRAGIVPASELNRYRHSSYWYLAHPKERPAFLRCTAALTAAGSLPDEPAGWRSYGKYLEWQAAEGPAGKNAAYVSMTKGWAIGTPEFKNALVKDQAAAVDLRAWQSEGAREVQRARWAAALARVVRELTRTDMKSTLKAAPWKVAVARYLKETTDVSNGWLAETLDMGNHLYVSKHIGLHRRSAGTESHRIHERIAGKVKGKA